MTTLRHWLPTKLSIAPLLLVIVTVRDAVWRMG